MKYRRSHYLSGTSPAYPKKGTLHQINFYLILTLGSTNRLGYDAVLWHKVKGYSHNNKNNTLLGIRSTGKLFH